jgi:hypothetical protein
MTVRNGRYASAAGRSSQQTFAVPYNARPESCRDRLGL